MVVTCNDIQCGDDDTHKKTGGGAGGGRVKDLKTLTSEDFDPCWSDQDGQN